MGKIREFFDELVIPTERAYKGLSILFMIYGIGFGVCLMIMYLLTTSHNNYNLDHPEFIPAKETINGIIYT